MREYFILFFMREYFKSSHCRKRLKEKIYDFHFNKWFPPNFQNQLMEFAGQTAVEGNFLYLINVI